MPFIRNRLFRLSLKGLLNLNITVVFFFFFFSLFSTFVSVSRYMEGPCPGRVCAAVGNFSQLMTLKGLKDAGILTQKQFEGQVQETLTLGDAPTVAPRIKKRAHASLLRTASSDLKQILTQMQMEGLCSNRMWNETELQRRRQRDSIIRLWWLCFPGNWRRRSKARTCSWPNHGSGLPWRRCRYLSNTEILTLPLHLTVMSVQAMVANQTLEAKLRMRPKRKSLRRRHRMIPRNLARRKKTQKQETLNPQMGFCSNLLTLMSPLLGGR